MFDLPIQRADYGASINLEPGQVIFVLGANGTGKSSLMQRFAQAVHGRAKRISAHRQTWLQSNSYSFAPSQKSSLEQQASAFDTSPQSRWMEQNPGIRSSVTLYDLIDAENIDSRAIAQAFRSGDLDAAHKLAARLAPIAMINQLLVRSNIPIVITVRDGDQVMASKNGGPAYSAAELSDGERNALLIAADVLTAKPNTLLIIDEPERHLHRSIISPLLTQLFQTRVDCGFVVATHDLTLPVDNPSARVLLVRSCAFSGQQPVSWEIDILEPGAEIDDELKQDVIGARRNILFIEGKESSLDKPLYSLLFPGISVRAKGTSREVEQSVKGIRETQNLNWVNAWGVIDGDARNLADIESLREESVYALPFYSVESIYYHPEIIRKISRRQAQVIGGDAEERWTAAITAALASVEPHLDRLAARAVEKRIRREVFSALPTGRSIAAGEPVSLHVDTNVIRNQEVERLRAAIADQNWLEIVVRCPVRETPALDRIAQVIEVGGRKQCEAAVLQLLQDDRETLLFARGMFGDLPARLGVT